MVGVGQEFLLLCAIMFLCELRENNPNYSTYHLSLMEHTDLRSGEKSPAYSCCSF